MVLEGPALLQDYRNLSRSKKHSSAWRMGEVDETLRRPSGRKEKGVGGGGGGGWHGARKPVGQVPNGSKEVLVTAPEVSTGPPGGSVAETQETWARSLTMGRSLEEGSSHPL